MEIGHLMNRWRTRDTVKNPRPESALQFSKKQKLSKRSCRWNNQTLHFLRINFAPHAPEADVQSLELEHDLEPDAPEPEAPEHLIDRDQEEEEIFVGNADDHPLEAQGQIQNGEDEYVPCFTVTWE